MRTARALTVLLISMVSLVALPTRLESSAAAATAPSQDALHEVLPGDDLRLIAGYYYGDTRQWERIWNANRDQVRNPNRIERGSLLRIPDATVPTESYADFVARARRSLSPQTLLTIPAVLPIPPAEAQIPDRPLASPEPPARPSPDRVALPAPPKTPAPSGGLTAPAPPPAPVPTPAQKAPSAPPAAAAPPTPPQKGAAPTAPPAPQPTTAPAVAATPPGAQPPSPSATPAPAPTKQATGPAAPQPTKAAGPSARPAPPPPKAWYEEWGLDELVTSPLFLGGVAVVLLGLGAILVIRRRRSAASAVAEVPE
jgi:hypothetical protein